MRTSATLWVVVLSAAAACTGTIGGGSDAGSTQQGLCADGSVKVPVTPMRRLTGREYDNAVRDLFGDDSRPSQSFVPDEVVAGFAANAVAPVTDLQVSDYVAAATAIAERAIVTHLPSAIDCDLASDECARGYLLAVGRRAFRRPVDAELEASLMSVYQAGKAEWGADKGMELAIRTILLSPHFLYHVEVAPDAAPGDIVPLDDYQVAARLAFFLWQSIPDDVLLDAAETGALRTRTGVAAQARRLLDDARSREAVASFFTQWLEIESLPERVKDAEAFPEWNEELGASMVEETVAFADHVVRGGESLTTLLTAPYSFVDAPLAALYGVAPPAEPWQRVDLDPSERAGLLTQASFLAGRSHAADTSWVYRGKFVRESLLCTLLPPPPSNVVMKESNDPSRVTNKDCAPCHTLMDPIGLGFERYDAIGAYHDDVDAHGELMNAEELTGKFESPVELAELLAKSKVVQACVALHAFRFGTRRHDTEDDSCSIDAIDAAFADSDLELSEMLVAIASSDALRFQRRAE